MTWETWAWHYTTYDALPSILESGLRPGSEVGRKECLPFVMLSLRMYAVQMGQPVVAVNMTGIAYRKVNREWIEVAGSIPASAIVRVAVPPKDNDEVFELMIAKGERAVEAAFDYRPVAEVRAALAKKGE